MSKHKNLSIFVPHLGCPNQCSFCDQCSISGAKKAPTVQEVQEICDNFLPKTDGENCEIAFFGGSFTAIDKKYMTELLQAVQPFITEGRASGVRVSTRPDSISTEILEILKRYNVTSIELGAQSMQDEVLKLNKRGHTAKDVIDASNLIKQYGFSLGLQMMTGLYGQIDYTAAALDTAQKFIKIKPDTVRIYPTITLKDTLLEKLYLAGEYQMPSLEETVEICTQLIKIFEKNDIKIIKLGLHADEGMQQKIVAGPYHPAFKELCQAQIFFEKIKLQLTINSIKSCIIKVNPSQLSQAKGQKNSNLQKFEQLGIDVQILPQQNVKKDDFIIETIDY